MASDLSREAWNSLVLSRPNTFFQSWEWGELQENLGRKVYRFIEDGLPFHFYEYELPLGRSYLYSPSIWMEGALVDSLRRRIAGLSSRAVFAKLEPLMPGAKIEGLRKGETVQPNKTGVIDLSKDREQLLREMEHDTRYAIRTAEKRGVTVECISEISEKRAGFNDFWELYQEMNDRKSLKTFPKKYYELVAGLNGDCRSKIFVAKLDGQPINAALVTYFGSSSNYLFAASKRGYGKYNAPSLTLWKIIEDSISEGMKDINLGGMFSGDESKEGLTKFKRSFGAAEMVSPGAFDLPVNPFWYELYRMAKRIRG